MTEVPLGYLKAHVPEEYERRMAIIQQGSRSAQARDEAKKKMLERMAWKKKRLEVAEKFDI